VSRGVLLCGYEHMHAIGYRRKCEKSNGQGKSRRRKGGGFLYKEAESQLGVRSCRKGGAEQCAVHSLCSLYACTLCMQRGTSSTDRKERAKRAGGETARGRVRG
jgi:hypothetical protein